MNTHLTPRHHRARRMIGTVVLAATLVGCGSADSNDEIDVDDRESIVPPEDDGVDGGVPNDNLDPDIDGPPDDVDGDGAPDG